MDLDLGANVTWTLPVEDVDLKVRFSVFNLTNNQEKVNIHSRYEAAPGVYRDRTSRTGTRWQSPRYAQLVVSWRFERGGHSGFQAGVPGRLTGRAR